jgi:hypothetical protein
VLQRNVAFGNEGFLFAQQNPDIKIICIFSFPWLFSPSERVLQSYWIFEEPKASQTKAKKRGGFFQRKKTFAIIRGPREGWLCFFTRKSKIANFFVSALTALAVLGWKSQPETAKAQEEVL